MSYQPLFISEDMQERFMAAVRGGENVRAAGAALGLTRSTAQRLWERLRTPEERRNELWDEDSTNYLCDLIADGYTLSQASARLPYTYEQCKSRFRTITKQLGWQAA